ncbi:uncharacterized protein EV422DRAFT_563241 [Fimicolochytrium jonesii]|uniref:uncharacterized protein n=1 Tax=Fimicolochytrium jonesii TaxID=1396493 RepID=UPI0022FED317|nr:uncharacterized protein EV422DRAFT_563241 [Fimicolochytrium jonesii]KAI8827161.1 hypothetical protein EV422DRAFT_563241 [Fimicolochytrium jonesii]
MAGPRLQCSASYLKSIGTLTFGQREFSWTETGADTPALRVPYPTVKSIAQNKNPAKPILKVTQSSPDDTEQPEVNHNLTFLAPDAVENRARVITLLGDVIQANNRTIKAVAQPTTTNEDLQIRHDILRKDEDLKQLHASLVLSRLISEDDFWAARQELLAQEKWQRSQRKGPTGVIIELRPSGNGSDGTETTYKVTNEMITSILSQYPIVKRAYDDTVTTNKITTEDFLRRFLESKYYQKRAGASIKASDEFFAKYETKDDDDYAEHPKAASYESSNYLLDLGAQSEDHTETGNRPDSTMRAGGVRASLPLIRQFNRVSEGVLKSTLAGQASLPKPAKPADEVYKESTELDDLRVEQKQAAKALMIGDVSKYYHAQAGSAAGQEDVTAVYSASFKQSLRQTILGWQPQLAKTSVYRSNADKVLKQLNEMTRKRKRDHQRGDDIPPPPATLQTYHLTATELLRTFWAAKKARNDAKAAKLITTLDEMARNARAVVEAADEEGGQSQTMFKAMLYAIERAKLAAV